MPFLFIFLKVDDGAWVVDVFFPPFRELKGEALQRMSCIQMNYKIRTVGNNKT